MDINNIQESLRALGCNAELIKAPGPVFQIGRDLISGKWKLITSQNYDEQRAAELSSCSIAEIVTAATLSIDGFNRDKPAIYRINADHDELFQQWIARLAKEIGDAKAVFIWSLPTVVTFPIHTIDPMKFEEARMSCGVLQKVFTLSDVKSEMVSTVFGRLYIMKD